MGQHLSQVVHDRAIITSTEFTNQTGVNQQLSQV